MAYSGVVENACRCLKHLKRGTFSQRVAGHRQLANLPQLTLNQRVPGSSPGAPTMKSMAQSAASKLRVGTIGHSFQLFWPSCTCCVRNNGSRTTEMHRKALT